AFCTATGTSRALPLPMPIPPSPSPTTVSAAKPKIRPPFTTLVTRFTEIIFSRSPSLRSSDCGAFAIVSSLELQTRFAGGVGQGFHSAVVFVTCAVKGDYLDAPFARLLGDALSNCCSRLDVASVRQPTAKIGIER